MCKGKYTTLYKKYNCRDCKAICALIIYISVSSNFIGMTDVQKKVRRLTRRAKPMTSQSAICFLSVEPNPVLVAFAERLSEHHRVYIMIDSNECSLPATSYVTFIRLNDEFCRNKGFYNTSPTIAKSPVAWDKALLYFSMIETSYKHVWFIEEDVFIPTTTILKQISIKYPAADLLVSRHLSRIIDHDWPWWHVCDDESLATPHYHAMICAVRMSRNLLQVIASYAKEKKKLIFVEVMLNTLAAVNNLRVETPIELSRVVHRHDWDESKLDTKHLIHPIKDLALHEHYRTILGVN